MAQHPRSDLMWYAKAGGEEMKVEAFGCKLLSNILDHDPKGGTVNLKVKFLVTSPDFVRLMAFLTLSQN